jgi:2-polyprenyl-3-methyl-5-hydroxy-6-metoxy-1,4-benzoquinol methylase
MFRRQRCPICGSGSLTNYLEINFAKGLLPDSYKYLYCSECDFAFSRPPELTNERLENYYSGKNRDHTSDTAYRVDDFATQLGYLQEYLISNPNVKILDFGCAEGRLLSLIHEKLQIPRKDLFGFDVFSNPNAKYQHFTHFNDVVNTNFDLIIVSHVLEHLLNFDVLFELSKILASNGVILIEVPNANRYDIFPRVTPGYYFDRLHLNHFTSSSLVRMMEKHFFRTLEIRESTFPYSDGARYPVLIGVFNRFAINGNFLEKTIQLDRKRVNQFAVENANEALIVWGLGDNFFRALSLGLFDSLVVVAIVDQDKNKLIPKNFPDPIGLKEALESFPQAAVLPMMSWGKSDAAAKVSALDPTRKILMF